MSDTAFTILGAGLADRYRLERELGAGGMATVYLAEDVRHHRKVAVGPHASRNIYYMTAGIDSALHPLALSSGEETNPVPSPDGNLVAYVSDETGTKELYLQPFPGGGVGRLGNT